MITIVDYKMGNLSSIYNMLKKIGVPSVITNDIGEIEKAERLILPGVGAFDNAMVNIEELGLKPILQKKVIEDKIPTLGICLGMQIITNGSEEGNLPGLGWIDAYTRKFKFDDPNLKVPHMGWNVTVPTDETSLFRNLNESKFYFVHSYHVVCNDPKNVLATTNYGFDFSSAIYKDNIFGTQFHPEKSHKYGMQLLGNFSKL